MSAIKADLLKLCHLIEALPASKQQTEISVFAYSLYRRCGNLKRRRSWACDEFKASEEDPNFCANCADLASRHKGPTPGAPRSYRP